VTAPICVGDFDFSGAVDSSDMSIMLLDYGVCGGCVTDLDQDSVVDSSDMSLLLLEFGACN